jgi:DNA recombination protein RmuC
LGEKLVPVDAKFPLESVRRAMEDPENPGALTPEVKKTFLGHVEAIAEKYILPAEGTLQFALLYIPSEKVFYHVFIGEDSGMMEEAVRRGVVPVSPSGLFLYLQTVAYGLKGFALSKNLEQQAGRIAGVRRELSALEKVLDTGGNHLKNLQNSFEEIRRRTAALSLGLSALDTLGNEAENEDT